MKYLVLMEPLSLENFIMANFVRIVVGKVRENEVTLHIWIVLILCKAILILPFVRVHTQGEWLVTDLVLSKLMRFSIHLL